MWMDVDGCMYVIIYGTYFILVFATSAVFVPHIESSLPQAGVAESCGNFHRRLAEDGIEPPMAFYAQCCEALNLLSPRSSEFDACAGEAVRRGLWPSIDQRPPCEAAHGCAAGLIESKPLWELKVCGHLTEQRISICMWTPT